MEVQLHGVPKKFSDVKPGGFFRSHKSKDFGICVSTNGKDRAAVLLKERATPQFHTKVPPEVVYFSQAIVRIADFEFSTDENQYGTLAVADDGEAYIQVPDEGASYQTFNLNTGLRTKLPTNVSPVFFSRWNVGILIDGKFNEIFSWPAKHESNRAL